MSSAGAPASLPESVSVKGGQTITGDKTFSGTTVLSGATTISGAATLSGGATLSGANTLSGATTISGALTVSGGITGSIRQIVPFSVTNVAAGDNATPASSTPVQAQWAGAAAVQVGWTAPRAGSLTGLSATLSSAAAGSSLIVGVYKNGTIMNAAAIVTLATTDTKAYGTFTQGTYTFAANDVIDVRIRTGSGWSATTADLGVAVEVAT